MILPPLLTFVSQSCDFWLLPHYAQLKKTAIRKMRPQNWRLLPLICQELFDASGNPFFSEIYARFHRYSHLPFFLEAEDSYLCEMLEDTEEFLSVLTSNHPKKKYDWLTASQQRTALAVHDTLYRLEKKYPSCHLPEEEPFQWTGLYERTPVYVQILQDLITKITTGAYPLEQYLPHEEDLAREYGVALTTLRKAMAELRGMGYIRTYNVKGSIAQKRPVEAARHTVQNPVHRQNAFRFLYALQFLALIAGPIAHRAAPGFTTKSLEEIEFQVQQPGAVPITVLADAISRNLDLEPLRVIFRETEHLVRWSYCAFSERNAGQQKRHMLTHVQSALNALKASDKDSFANAVAGYYSNAFSQICAQYVQYYKIKDAKSIVSPSYEWLQ
ncbi:GntR family transcriptional regulator [Enterocloster clostridioformis]|uniref:GntR family transcriptional regulator n=1 Tax=Enterocloster clostridioformis TaxID=1531 RepID=UPI0036F24B64